MSFVPAGAVHSRQDAEAAGSRSDFFADACKAWVKLIEGYWVLQSACTPLFGDALKIILQKYECAWN